jgi:hypothetical protein
MRGRPPGSRNKKPKSDLVSKNTKRKRHQRMLENAVRLHELFEGEPNRAREANPGGDESCLYQGTQAKILGKSFDRVAERMKRKHR